MRGGGLLVGLRPIFSWKIGDKGSEGRGRLAGGGREVCVIEVGLNE